MKTILIVRHAKSSPADIGQADFDRSLNNRGKEDAVEMAKKVSISIKTIDAFISSPAKRARKTAEKFMKEYGVDKKDLLFAPTLYEAHQNDFYEVVEALDNSCKTIAIFSHNPGITDFANSQNCLNIFNMPTGSVFAVQIETDRWSEIRIAERKSLFFYLPKDEE